jgi:site-specific DNA-methyltransferase (adenine-specific)
MLHIGNCLDVLPQYPDNCFDAVVTDPPYGLEFMGKEWDAPWKSAEIVTVTDEATNGIFHTKGFTHGVRFSRGTDEMRAFQAWCTEWAIECLRLLKPGGHLLAFGGSRTYHRLACAVEDAGFEIRDQIMWVYGSGFPKSLNVSKSIEGLLTIGSANKTEFKKLSGEQVERGDWGMSKLQFIHGQRDTNYDETAGDRRLGKLDPTTPEARQWMGWGTALKPAHEPIVLARKPLDGTVAQNILKHGTGALNIDATRIPFGDEPINLSRKQRQQHFDGGIDFGAGNLIGTEINTYKDGGRWPANFIHDGSDEVLELFPEVKGGTWNTTNGARLFDNNGEPTGYETTGRDKSMGTAARFFYCAKASTAERNLGLGDLPDRRQDEDDYERAGTTNPHNRSQKVRKNHHPTVKPIALMRHLIRMVTPQGGIVLDPFLGSGTTAVAATLDGIQWVGCEMDGDYAQIIMSRVAHAQKQVQ